MTLLRLHSDALAISVDDDRLQLRSPDGQHLTFDANAILLAEVFDRLREGADLRVLDEVLGEDLASELTALLHARGLLVADGEENACQFARLLTQHKAGGGAVLDASPPRAVEIVGDGKIASLARTVAASATVASADTAETLLVACSDHEDWSALLAFNAQAVAERRTITFVRWDQSRLLIGPFVIPGESACLECVAHRQRAACLHPDELLAWRRNAAHQPVFQGGVGLSTFVQAAIEHHVEAILAGAYDLARPGAILILDPVAFRSSVAPVMRLPRCPTCRPSSETVLRSIRDLN